MKKLVLATAILISGAASQSMAYKSLACDGGTIIHTEAPTVSIADPYLGLGNMQPDDKFWELGQVVLENGQVRQELWKAEDGKNGILGKKGFGLYMGGTYRLDLSNTVGNFKIYLENSKTGKSVRCHGIGNGV